MHTETTGRWLVLGYYPAREPLDLWGDGANLFPFGQYSPVVGVGETDVVRRIRPYWKDAFAGNVPFVRSLICLLI